MSKLKLLVLVLLVAGISAAVYWFNQNPPGVTMINPARPPEPILEPAEVEKIRTLQNTKEVYLLGGVSPDDTTVMVIAGTGEDSSHAYWLNLQTGQMETIDAKVLEFFPQGDIAWSDHQTAVYFSSNANGDPVLVTVSRQTGEIKVEALEISGRPLSLAPDGSRLLIENGTPDSMELAVLDRQTDQTQTLLSYSGGSGPVSIAWNADGSKLALVRYDIPPEMASSPEKIAEMATREALGNVPLKENQYLATNIIDIIDLSGEDSLHKRLHAADGDGYLFKEVSWSPDGQLLLVKMVSPSQPAGRDHPSLVALGAFAGRSSYRFYDSDLNLIEQLDRPETEAPSISSAMFISPQEVIVTAAYGLSMRLSYFNVESGEFRILPTGAGTFGERLIGFQVFATHQSRQLVYNQSSFEHPSEIYLLDLEGSAPKALSAFNTEVAAVNQIRVDEVSFQLAEDTIRTGYLIQPAGAEFPPQNVPIVIHHQGGPGGAMTNRWGATTEDPFSLLPNFGISILFMPFAGREGFGPEFYLALADEDNFGQIDVDEAALAVQYLLELGYAGENQVGVNGCSYGGYVVNQSITQYPDLYAAAISQCSIMDMVDYWGFNPYLVTFYEGSLPE
ncbi:MAG TPA: prolyl oligopeptidase family serine peptidase, partial [Anaerolineales bacterium]|nr:prolyl oligopeptidase family serine peptidase [Anaerolineales bacterium]